jgi:predicted nuclease of predicted toxin-antitoxin system
MAAFLADMPVPQSAVRLARDLGHDAIHVRDYGMQRASDSQILRRAAAESRIVMTMDLDFAREVALSPRPCPGLIIFRLGNVSAQEITKAFRQLLMGFTDEELEGHVVIVEPGRVRRRVLPINRSQGAA